LTNFGVPTASRAGCEQVARFPTGRASRMPRSMSHGVDAITIPKLAASQRLYNVIYDPLNSTAGRQNMRNAVAPSLFALCVIAAFAPVAKGADECVAYGDESAEFTWRLCPAGEKYERRYIYFGVWSNFYRVRSDAGACRWSA